MSLDTATRQSAFSKFGRASGRAARGSMKGIAYVIALLICGIFILWDADWRQLRDRLENFYEALFTDYVSPECSVDPTDCIDGRKQKPIGPPPAHVCDRQPELAMTCQMQSLYTEMNTRFFGGRLPGAVITLQRKRMAAGYFAFKRFTLGQEQRVTDEIALNPQYFHHVTMRRLVSTLAHEMCHQEIAHFDVPPKGGFHSIVWARCMLRIVLTPVSQDRPGTMIGTRVSHKIRKSVPYDRFAARHPLIGNKKVPLRDRR